MTSFVSEDAARIALQEKLYNAICDVGGNSDGLQKILNGLLPEKRKSAMASTIAMAAPIAMAGPIKFDDDRGKTLLYIAAAKTPAEFVSLLIAAGADPLFPMQEGERPLDVAVANGRADVVKVILDHLSTDAKALAIAIPKKGNSLLYIAAENGCAEVARLLLAAGADPLADAGGNKPLCVATRCGHAPVVEAMLQTLSQDAKDTAIKTASGESMSLIYSISLLYIAASLGRSAVVGIILKHLSSDAKALVVDAPIKTGYDEGMTPLYIASARGHFDVAMQLLAEGVDPLKVCNLAEGVSKSPLDIARERGRSSLESAMLEEVHRRIRWTSEGSDLRNGWAAAVFAGGEARKIKPSQYKSVSGEGVSASGIVSADPADGSASVRGRC